MRRGGSGWAPSAGPTALWPIILINLRRQPARRQSSLARLDELGLACTVVEAVDGSLLDHATVQRVYCPARNAAGFKRPLSAGEIGCYLSHIEIWRRVAASGTPAVVLEDDFAADDDLPAVLWAMTKSGVPDAVIKLGCSPRRVTRIAAISDRHALVDPWTVPPYTTGYVITPGAAAMLLARALPFGRPVDTDLKHWWEFGVRVLAVYPGVVRPGRGADATSTLEAGRRATKSGSRLVRCLRNLSYQARFLANQTRARMQAHGAAARAVPAPKSAPRK